MIVSFCSWSTAFLIIGVADGVGGWRNEGVDPSIFTVALMEYCAHISASSLWRGPVDILEEAYRLVLKDSQVIAGKIMCCTVYPICTVGTVCTVCTVCTICTVCIVCTVCTVCTVYTVCSVCTVCIACTMYTVCTV